MQLRRLIPILLTAAAAFAQTPPPQPPPPREIKTYTLPPDKLQKAIEYSRAGNVLYFAGVAWSALAMLGLIAARVAPRYRDIAERVSHNRFVQAYLFVPLLFLTFDILCLPPSLAGHVLAVRYDQSVQRWGSWFRDWMMGELISFLILGFVIWLLFALVRCSPRRWWFYGWLTSIPIVVFLLFVSPVLIDPIFNQFTPLAATQPALVDSIEKVTARGGLSIPRDHMFEMAASVKTNAINAYVSGIGASKRVVVWDTAIRKMTVSQTLFVFGHEMGHYVLGHVWYGIAFLCALLLLLLYAGYHSMHWALVRWGARLSIRGIDDWAALPLLVLTSFVLGFVGQPVFSSYSRMQEHHADIYGLEVLHGLVPNSAQTAAQAFQILGEDSLIDPNPGKFVEFWLYDHPSISNRVAFAAAYDPWSPGRAPLYVK